MMISPIYARLMARYNRWQNDSLMTAADSLTADERAVDRGAFFGSIDRTFRHLYWDDQLWHARFNGDQKPEATIPVNLEAPHDWETFKIKRREIDDLLIKWSGSLNEEALTGNVSWYPGGGSELLTRPRWQAMVHLFNHQTHHRGQIHAMLTSAGASPEPTDLPMLKV